jgi:hypothetical protein
MKSWLILAAAGLGGFGIGLVAFPRPHVERDRPAIGEITPKVDAASAARSSAIVLSALGAPDFTARLGQLLAGLKDARKDALLAQLQQVSDDKSLVPELAAFCRKEIIGRLIERGVIQDAMDFGDVRQREDATQIVVEKLASIDPARAEAMINDSLTPGQRRVATRALFSVLGKTDPERGLKLLRSRPDLRDEGYPFFGEWAKVSPQVASEAALKLQKDIGADFLHGAIYQWSADDPQAAAKWVETLPPDLRDQGRSAYMNAMVNKDPSAALDTLLANPELGTNFADWIGRKLGTDRANAEALLGRVPPGELRTRLIGGIANSLGQGDPTIALAWTQTLLPGEQEVAVHSVFRYSLASSDPEAAIALANRYLKGSAATEAIVSTAREWADNDFASAFSAVTKFLHGEDLKQALPKLITPNYSIYGTNPGIQLAVFSKLPPDVKMAALGAMGAQWGMIEPEGPADRLAALAPDERTAFVEGWLRGVNDSSSHVTARFIQWLPPEKQVQNAAQISRSLASADPAVAGEFLLGLPGDPNSRIPAMRELVGDWTYENPAAATTFVARIPPGAAHDAVAIELARQMRTFDPDGATRQLAGISAAPARANFIREMCQTWNRVDPARGRSLLLAAARSDDERNAITSALGGSQ